MKDAIQDSDYGLMLKLTQLKNKLDVKNVQTHVLHVKEIEIFVKNAWEDFS